VQRLLFMSGHSFRCAAVKVQQRLHATNSYYRHCR
jgi:hypothetical protein